MDCGTIPHLIARFGCHLGNTTVDETLGFVGLVVIGVGGFAVLVHTLVKHWNPPVAKQSEQPNVSSGTE